MPWCRDFKDDEGATPVNSLDPWRVILTTPAGEIVVPAPSYGHAFYREVPSWIHYGNGSSTNRMLFDGAFVGAEIPSTNVQRTGLTAMLAPIVAPASGGLEVRKELDDKQILRVEICVDGKCYQASMNLAPAIAVIMQKLEHWHKGVHAQMPLQPPLGVVGAVDAAVCEAADAIVGELIGCHYDTICGSFLGDIAGAVKGAAHGVASAAGKITSGVRSTLRKLKGPIGAAAAVAAAAAASAIPGVGLIAAPIAAKLANDLVQAAAGNDAAKKQVAQAQKQAQTNPTVALALEAATKAAANATVAHHVQDTAKQASQGDPAAQQQIAQVSADAQQGDPAAKAVADIILNALRQATTRASTTMSGQWHDIVGGDCFDAVRERAQRLATSKSGGAIGAIHSKLDGHWHTYAFARPDEALDWLQGVTCNRQNFTYAGAFNKAFDGEACLQDEEIGEG